MRVSETAFAKINLALHVRSRRVDGYHELETLFAFAQAGDEIHVAPAKDLSLSIEGPFAAGLSHGEDNLVLQAARALQQAYAVTSGARIILEKNLPIASGIGGGSADAAATIRALSALWELPSEERKIAELARKLGADVPACLRSVTVMGKGVGELLFEVEARALSGLPLLLVNPGIACSTAAVFARWSGTDEGSLTGGVTLVALAEARNDLETPAIALVPQIETVLAHLSQQAGTTLVRMSGSGATCFALFESERDRDAAARAMSPFWTLATRLR